MLSLRELQRRFADAVTRPVAADPTLLAVVAGRGALGGAERVAIYADMYEARLVDVLREDFPKVCAALGDDDFRDLAGRYLARHPSTHPSVRHVGRSFAGFLDEETPRPVYLADLARLEWARVEAFDAADAEPLQGTDLDAVAPADWPVLRLALVPSCQVIECAWPAHEIWTGAAPAEPRPTTLRVWREGWSVSHAPMGDLERALFPLLRRGESFARLCEAADDGDDPEAAARGVGGLLMRWLEDGVLARP